MNPLRSALAIVRESRRVFLMLNAVYFGLIVAAMIVTVIYPAPQEWMYEQLGAAFEEGPLATVAEAYTGGQTLKAIGLTFGINLVIGSFVSINLPSLIIPFSGYLIAVYRAILWGVLFAPNPAVTTIALGPVLGLVGLLFLEGEGYVLAMFAAYEQGRSFLWPASVGAEGRWQGFKIGFKRMGLVYILVALTLIVAAIYEVGLVALMPAD